MTASATITSNQHLQSAVFSFKQSTINSNQQLPALAVNDQQQSTVDGSQQQQSTVDSSNQQSATIGNNQQHSPVINNQQQATFDSQQHSAVGN